MVHQKVLTIVSLELLESWKSQNAVPGNTSKERIGLVQSENLGDIPY